VLGLVILELKTPCRVGDGSLRKGSDDVVCHDSSAEAFDFKCEGVVTDLGRLLLLGQIWDSDDFDSESLELLTRIPSRDTGKVQSLRVLDHQGPGPRLRGGGSE
jgi:hypothetical protein